MHVYTDGDEWYVAESFGHADVMRREQYFDSDGEWLGKLRQLDDAALLTITQDPYDVPDTKITKTCAEWAADRGPGLLCSANH
jgi:hypothetical protein